MNTALETLKKDGRFFNPSNYFCSFTGDHTGIIRYSFQISNPKHEGAKRYEGIVAEEFGFSILFDHGKLCAPSFMKFPMWATETDFAGALSRMVEFINQNYEREGGLPAYLHGD